MDSKTVNREIRAIVWPLLKEAGFVRSTARTFRRYAKDRIDVVNFQSFTSYQASSSVMTTYSFALNLGCYFTAVPRTWPLKRKGDLLLREEYHCHFRRRLRKAIHQPQLEMTDIWYIDEEGYYLESAVHDARVALLHQAMPWFQRFSDYREVLRTLLEDADTDDGTWGMGANPSPNRHYLTGYIALAVGEKTLAIDRLHAACEWFRKLNQEPFRMKLSGLPFGN